MPFDVSKVEVGDTLYLAIPSGWSSRDVHEYIVQRKTPKGQVVAKRGDRELRVSSAGRIHGGDTWSRERLVSAEEAAIIRADAHEQKLWFDLRKAVDELEKAARNQDDDAVDAAMSAAAKAIEARQGGNAEGGAVHESAVPAGHSPEPSIPSSTTKEVGE